MGDESRMEKELAPLLWQEWKADSIDPCLIIGFWAEDNSTYHIRIPEQLRDILVIAQNALHEKYIAIDHAKCVLHSLRAEADSLTRRPDHETGE